MERKKTVDIVTVTIIKRPARRLMLLRSVKASDYFSYCEEMGCDWEEILNNIPEKLDSAAILTLPDKLVKTGTSAIAAGIEVPADYSGKLPEKYEIIELPACEMLYFQGMPYEDKEEFIRAIEIVNKAIEEYKPEMFGYKFACDLIPEFNFGALPEKGARIMKPVKAL